MTEGRYAFTSVCHIPPAYSSAAPAPPTPVCDAFHYIDRRRQRLQQPPQSPSHSTCSAQSLRSEHSYLRDFASTRSTVFGTLVSAPGWHCGDCTKKEVELRLLKRELGALRRRHEEVLSILHRLHPELVLPDAPADAECTLTASDSPAVPRPCGRAALKGSAILQRAGAAFLRHLPGGRGLGRRVQKMALGVLGVDGCALCPLPCPSGPSPGQACAARRGRP